MWFESNAYSWRFYDLCRLYFLQVSGQRHCLFSERSMDNQKEVRILEMTSGSYIVDVYAVI